MRTPEREMAKDRDPRHEELLLAYAAGRLAEAPALLIASQAALVPAVRHDIAAYEALGGRLLEETPPAPVAARTRAAVLSALDAPPGETPRETLPRRAAGAPDGDPLPSVLTRHLPGRLDALSWRRMVPGLRQWTFPAMEGGLARLIWVAGGTALPQHSHRGPELTLVLVGAYWDGELCFRVGDLQIADPSIDHRPEVRGDEPCLCLAVTDAPLRLTGRFSRLLNPFLKT